jgi:CheY-like chemotaxis protein
MSSTILVIDDSKAVRLLAKNALAGFDCFVNEATNGFTGLYAIERAMPDLLLLDVSMPTMNGVEMLEMLKGHAQLKTIPVIMLHATTDHRVMPRITELGVEGLVKKPFTADTLIDAVRSVLPLKPRKS